MTLATSIGVATSCNIFWTATANWLPPVIVARPKSTAPMKVIAEPAMLAKILDIVNISSNLRKVKKNTNHMVSVGIVTHKLL